MAEDIFNFSNYFLNEGHTLYNGFSKEYDKAFVPSPWHGRSQAFISKENNTYLVVKGIGCPYLSSPYFNSNEMDGHIWGFLDEKTAKYEFENMQIANRLLNGRVSAPVALKKIIDIDGLHPCLIYYNVRNPYRLIDLDFFNSTQKKEIRKNILSLSSNPSEKYVHIVVVERLCEIIKILYDNNLVHNALSVHNVTCSLELVDFESSFIIDFDDEDFELKASIIPREMIQLREIAYSVSWWFQEKYNIKKIDKLINNSGIAEIIESKQDNHSY